MLFIDSRFASLKCAPFVLQSVLRFVLSVSSNSSDHTDLRLYQHRRLARQNNEADRTGGDQLVSIAEWRFDWLRLTDKRESARKQAN